MPTRRSHQKSRRGCLNCKSRHVKCDEALPTCQRCNTRGLECDFGCSDPSPRTLPSRSSGAEPARPATSKNPAELIFPANSRLLELQLMHRWSTVTYKSCTTPGADDDEVWQHLVPDLAVQHNFLLNGLFALAAFEIASLKKHDNEQYVNAALEYHTLALGSFRSQLPALNSESHEAALCLSLMLMVFALASAQFASKTAGDEDSMVQRAITVFELLRGCVPVAESKKGYLAENPYIRKMPRFEDLPRVALDARLQDAIAKMGELNDRRIALSVRESDDRRVQQIACWEACKKALALLRQCFEKCVDRLSQGYVLGWLNMAGEDYVKAVKEGDHAALLMLVYWGVLVDKFGRQVWWTQHFGRLLVDEILHGPLSQETDATTRDLIMCAKELVSCFFVQASWSDMSLSASSPALRSTIHQPSSFCNRRYSENAAVNLEWQTLA